MKKSLVILDIVQLVLSIIGMFIFSFIFFVVNSIQRYLFLICLIYAAYSFINAWQDLEIELRQVKQPKEKKVKEKMLKKVSI